MYLGCCPSHVLSRQTRVDAVEPSGRTHHGLCLCHGGRQWQVDDKEGVLHDQGHPHTGRPVVLSGVVTATDDVTHESRDNILSAAAGAGPAQAAGVAAEVDARWLCARLRAVRCRRAVLLQRPPDGADGAGRFEAVGEPRAFWGPSCG